MKELIGAWKLLFITNSTVQGPNPIGRIVFTPSGYMNAMVIDGDKAATFKNETTWRNSSDVQMATLVRPIVAYSGPYRVEKIGKDIFTHVNVEVSISPEWIGTDQVRRAEFGKKDGKSLLTLFPFFTNGTATGTSLSWEKM